MSEKLKNARLILNTGMFYPASTGTIAGAGALDPRMGTADASRLNCTFTNLDWMMILGDLYDQYITFSLVIESVNYLSVGGTPFSAFINVTASGPEWIDQTYDVLTKSKGGGCIIYSGALYGNNVPQSEGFIFRKPANRYRDLVLTITNPVTGTQAGVFDRPASLVYAIKIFGVTLDDHKHA
jgi:hypothetical protein